MGSTQFISCLTRFVLVDSNEPHFLNLTNVFSDFPRGSLTSQTRFPRYVCLRLVTRTDCRSGLTAMQPVTICCPYLASSICVFDNFFIL